MEKEFENTDTLEFRYISGKCTPEEERRILSRISEDGEYAKMLAEMRNLYVAFRMPDGRASDEEFRNFRIYARRKDSEKRRTAWNRIAVFTKYTAVAAVVLLLALNLHYNWLGHVYREPVVKLSYVADSLVNTLHTERGVKGKVTLPDGSVVFMNSDSEIRYPSAFSGATREVEFSGEGYFSVIKDSLHPMIVRCNRGFNVEVYGTEFNIRSYDDEDISKATLYSGKIRVVDDSGKTDARSALVKPNESVIMTKDMEIEEPLVEPSPENVRAWKDGKLVFDSITLEEASRMMERWHGVTIVFENRHARDIPVTARFSTESVSQIFELLRFSTGIDYEIKDNVVTIK